MKVITMILGILLTVGGFICMFMPGRTFLSSGWALGFMVLVSGVNMVVLYCRDRKETPVWNLFGGIIFVILGGITLFSLPTRILTDVFIAYAFGFGLLCYGIFQIVSSVRQPKKENASWGFSLAFGILDVLLGGYCFFHPMAGAVTVGVLIAFVIITQGFSLIGLASSMEK